MSKCVVKYILLFSLLSLIPFMARGEEPKQHLSAILGGGFGVYFNDLQTVPAGKLHSVLPNGTFRLYWETGYRLKLGIETGYYPIYSAKAVLIDGQLYDRTSSTLSVIPIMVNVDMRIVKGFHLSIATGLVDMIYSVKDPLDHTAGSQFSLANYSVGAAYYWPLTKQLDIGAEVRYMRIGKTEDNHMAFQVALNYKLFSWGGKK